MAVSLKLQQRFARSDAAASQLWNDLAACAGGVGQEAPSGLHSRSRTDDSCVETMLQDNVWHVGGANAQEGIDLQNAAQRSELKASNSNARLGEEIASLRHELKSMSCLRQTGHSEIVDFASNRLVTDHLQGVHGTLYQQITYAEPIAVTTPVYEDRRNLLAQRRNDRVHDRTAASQLQEPEQLQEQQPQQPQLQVQSQMQTQLPLQRPPSEQQQDLQSEVMHAQSRQRSLRTFCAAQSADVACTRQEVRAAQHTLQETLASLSSCEASCTRLERNVHEHLELLDYHVDILGVAVGKDCTTGRQLGHEKGNDHRNVSDVQNRLDSVLSHIAGHSSELQELQDEQAFASQENELLNFRHTEQCSRYRELEAHARLDASHLQQVEHIEEKRAADIKLRLRDEEGFCHQVQEQLEAEQCRRMSMAAAAQRHAHGLAPDMQRTQDEARELSRLLSEEQFQLSVIQAAPVPRAGDDALAALDRKDASVWELNEKLIGTWRKEEAAMKSAEEQRKCELALSGELSVEEGAILELEAEETRLLASAESTLQQIHTGGLLSQAWEATEEEERENRVRIASEIAELESELAAEEPAPQPPSSHQALRGGLQAMRDVLKVENSEWRSEMQQVRDIAMQRVQEASRKPSVPAPSSRRTLPVPGPSAGTGFQRALQAWDTIFEGGTSCKSPDDGYEVVDQLSTSGRTERRLPAQAPWSENSFTDTNSRLDPWPPVISTPCAMTMPSLYGMPGSMDLQVSGEVRRTDLAEDADIFKASLGLSNYGMLAPPPLQPQGSKQYGATSWSPSSCLGSTAPAYGELRSLAEPALPSSKKSVGHALDTLDAFMRGRASKQQADAEWSRIEEDEGQRIDALAAQRSSSTLSPDMLSTSMMSVTGRLDDNAVLDANRADVAALSTHRSARSRA